MDFKAKGVTTVTAAIEFATQTKDLEVTLTTAGANFHGIIAQADSSMIVLKNKSDLQADYEKNTYSFVSPNSVIAVSFTLKENKK